MSINIRLEKTCQHCSEKFIAKTMVTAFCSDNCAKHNNKNRKLEEMDQLVGQKENKRVLFNPIFDEKDFLSIYETCLFLGKSRWTTLYIFPTIHHNSSSGIAGAYHLSTYSRFPPFNLFWRLSYKKCYL